MKRMLAEILIMAEGYCVKCKAKQPISDAVEEIMKNGRKAIKGRCPTCGTVMFKILGGKGTAVAPAPEAPPSVAPAPTPPKPVSPESEPESKPASSAPEEPSI